MNQNVSIDGEVYASYHTWRTTLGVPMDLDENICLCFHVSLRKVKKFIRLEKPIRASQISQCYGAGTGCGWCRPFLEKLLAEANSASEATPDPESKPRGDSQTVAQQGQQGSSSDDGLAAELESLSPNAYADLRKTYIEKGHGSPP